MCTGADVAAASAGCSAKWEAMYPASGSAPGQMSDRWRRYLAEAADEQEGIRRRALFEAEMDEQALERSSHPEKDIRFTYGVKVPTIP